MGQEEMFEQSLKFYGRHEMLYSETVLLSHAAEAITFVGNVLDVFSRFHEMSKCTWNLSNAGATFKHVRLPAEFISFRSVLAKRCSALIRNMSFEARDIYFHLNMN